MGLDSELGKSLAHSWIKTSLASLGSRFCYYTDYAIPEQKSGEDELEPLESVCVRSLSLVIADSSLYNESPRLLLNSTSVSQSFLELS